MNILTSNAHFRQRVIKAAIQVQIKADTGENVEL